MGQGEFQRPTRAPPERDVVPVLCSATCISEEERWLGALLPDLTVALFPVTWKPQRKGPRPRFYGSDLRHHETCVFVCLDPVGWMEWENGGLCIALGVAAMLKGGEG